MNSSTQYLKSCLLTIALLIAALQASAQPMNGTYTIAGTTPDFTTLIAAVNSLNARGVNGPVIFNIRDGNYSGSSWKASINTITGASSTNTITFQSQSGNKTNCVISAVGTSSSNYIFRLNNSNYITLKNLTLNNTNSSYGTDVLFTGTSSYNRIENCVLTGHTGNSTSTNKCRVYGTSLSGAENNAFINNHIKGGSYGIYFRGNSTVATSNGHVFEGNNFDQNYYYAIYAYYLGDIRFKKNTVTRTGSGTYYGCYFYYTRNSIIVDSNEITINATGTIYGVRFNYSNYSSNDASAYVAFTNNKVDITSTSGTVYAVDTRYSRYGYIANNEIKNTSASTSGNYYNYLLYACYNSKAEKNEITCHKAGGYVRNYMMYSGSVDTCNDNVIRVDGNSYIYNYMAYQTQNYYVTNNDVNLKNNNRTIYGTYVYYYAGVFANNKIVHESNTGSVTGLYMDYANGAKIYNNVVYTKTNGSNYGVRAYYVYPTTTFFNNTIYTTGSSNTCYNMYVYNSSSSYGIKCYNNIFYRPEGNGYNLYYNRNENIMSDYNLYYKPSDDIFTGITNAENLPDWRASTKLDRNSVMHDVEFTDAATNDYSILASSESAWAVNGRAMHDTARKTDYGGNAVPAYTTDGVPDIGAFEVTPATVPPLATASPTAPAISSTQFFTFAQDTVLAIEWGQTVPSTYEVRQYTGVKATPVPAGLQRMFFYVEGTPSTYDHAYKAYTYYKDPWIGDIPSEDEAVMARKSDNGGWVGYNYNNALTDTARNIVATVAAIDSIGSFTAVRNGRIGIRCVYAPTGIKISGITAFSADISWNPIFNPLAYQVIVKTSATAPTFAQWAASASPTVNSLSAGGLSENTSYYVFVRSICGDKDTSGYTIDSFQTIITCHAPAITAYDIQNSRVVVFWDSVITAVKYECAIAKSATPPEAGTIITRTEMLFSNLDEGTTYYAHVRAHCNTMYTMSDWSTVEIRTWEVGVEKTGEELQKITLFPNPVQDKMIVSIPANYIDGTISISDITGRTIIQQNVSGSEKVEIGVGELTTGVYLLEYNNTDVRQAIRFSKQDY